MDTDYKFLITPGLSKSFDNFIERCENYHKPVLVHGNTGVGKSLFVHLFTEIARRQYNGQEMSIMTLNCSIYEKEMIAGELFGTEPGAFTGAIKREGLIKKADNGVLVLEEIGELPPNVQPKLLTFLDTGKFIPLGGREEISVAVKIIATTNKMKSEFRADLWYRFLDFEIPAIYKRRHDIFYYMYFISPDIFNRLTKWQLLCLLTYNWPGNVREIKNEIEKMSQKDFIDGSDKENKHNKDNILDPHRVFSYENQTIFQKYFQFVNGRILLNFMADLMINGVDIKKLESKLNENALGLILFVNDLAFPEFKGAHEVKFKKDSNLKVYAMPESLGNYIVPFFLNVFDGFIEFCRLFHVSPFSEHNLLIIDEKTASEHFRYTVQQVDNLYGNKKDITDLEKEILYYFKNKGLIKSTNLYNEQNSVYDSNPDIYQINIAIGTYKDIEEIEKVMILKRIEQTGGNKAKAARLMGMDESTLKRRLNKYNS